MSTPLTDEEVTILARDVATRHVYVAGINEETAEEDMQRLELSFPILLMCDPEQIPATTIAVYEYLDRAMPMAINGQPMFMSCRFLLEENRERFVAELARFEQALGVQA